MAADNQPEQTNEESNSTEVSETANGISVDMTIQHPLQSAWTLWFYQNDKSKKWEDCQIIVASFSTVEEFWAIFNHVNSASNLPTNCDYSIFKNGVKPMWEDSANKNGGRWLINFQRNQKCVIDQCWLEVILCLIGEGFGDDGDNVNGAVVSVRAKGDKIGLWTAEYKNATSVLNIGKILKERVGIDRMVIGFQSHEQAASRQTSRAKDMYTI